jgi:pimeloyl-ACP methyl ester carboxylesterase
MHNQKYKYILIICALCNFALALFLISTSKLATLEEARGMAAGVTHWCMDDFEPANDVPPLARMVGVLPLLQRGCRPEYVSLKTVSTWGGGPDLRERELNFAGRFAKRNARGHNFCYQPRMMNLLWWLIGAGAVLRWSGRLYGGIAGVFALVVWSFVPVVLDHESLATPELPAAVACAAATYSFRCYLLRPTWERTIVSGVLLGIAELVEFVSLILVVIWPLMILVHRLAQRRGIPGIAEARPRPLQVAVALALSVWVINMGYAFKGSGSPLGHIEFVGTTLKEDAPPSDQPATGQGLGNPFRDKWLGRVRLPLPMEYVRGLQRRWDERETAGARRIEEERTGGAARSRWTRLGGRLPIGIWLMMLVSLALLVSQQPCSAPAAEELVLWLPAAAFLTMPAQAIGPLSPDLGILLATPFVGIIASKVASFGWASRTKGRWLALGLTAFTAGELIVNVRDNCLPIGRRTRFRQDLVRQSRKWGLAVPEPRTSVGTGTEERGLLYRTFVDSRGFEMNYAIYVPVSYRGDRSYPLIVFLHGHGERGSSDPSNRMYTEVGLPFTLKYRPIDFLVLCPQGQSGGWVADDDDVRRTMELLDAVQKEYRVDAKRISLTGLSSGGAGVCEVAVRYPDRWSALAPVAGWGDPGLAASIKHIPCWCFHNRYDAFHPVDEPRKLIENLRALGAHPRYTEYLDTNHNAGERAYVLPELYDWLERQRLP